MNSDNYFILGALALTLMACGDDEAQVHKDYVRPVKIIEIVGQSGNDVREFAGKVASADVSNLSFRIGGEIKDLPVFNGKQIEEGQIVARLDPADAENALTNAQAQFELATAEHIRKQSLFKQRVISKSSYDLAYTNLVSATAALDQARDNMTYTLIKAPFNGVIGRVNVENHEVVGPNQIIATIQGEEVIEITIQLPESIVANVRPQGEIGGYQPQAWFTSNPNTKYLVTFKENAAEANRGSQTYNVTFTLNRPEDLLILPGMSATVELNISRITRSTDGDRYILPLSAITRVDGQDKTYIWKFDAETKMVSKVEVELGKVVDEGVEILLGLKRKDRVVTAGLSELYEGMTVRPLQKERGL